MTKESEGVWATIGKLSAVVTLVGSLAGLYVFFWPSGPHLDAEGIYHDFTLPPDMIDGLAKLRTTQSCSAVSDRLQKYLAENPGDLGGISIFGMSRVVCEPVEDQVADLQGLLYRGFWYFSIHNSGTRPANTVVLDTPFTGIALISGDQQQVVPIKGVVSIGTLRGDVPLTVEI